MIAFALGISKLMTKYAEWKNSFKCSHFRGPAFIPFIDQLPSLNRRIDGPFIMPIVDKYKEMGTVLMGKVESGECKKGQSLLVMPNRVRLSSCSIVVTCHWCRSTLDTSNGGSAVVR